MEEKFKEAFKRALEIENREIGLTDEFREYDEWDSLGLLSLIAILDEEFGVEMEIKDFSNSTTIGQLLEEVLKRNKQNKRIKNMR